MKMFYKIFRFMAAMAVFMQGAIFSINNPSDLGLIGLNAMVTGMVIYSLYLREDS